MIFAPPSAPEFINRSGRQPAYSPAAISDGTICGRPLATIMSLSMTAGI